MDIHLYVYLGEYSVGHEYAAGQCMLELFSTQSVVVNNPFVWRRLIMKFMVASVYHREYMPL